MKTAYLIWKHGDPSPNEIGSVAVCANEKTAEKTANSLKRDCKNLRRGAFFTVSTISMPQSREDIRALVAETV